ncbi:PGR5-like protein 1B, chloroplastic isoform X1 [Punica granatum]|uniref:Uncharacterized protein n=2 Tax=Punica granatum TaxID=22663 RepID=A0A218W2K6_PUNGR|nr:PGR5-like protein 1B, chloroplastic isoform X1 [Punica granatum]OWM66783.1 hypothetical protein CDL15_Pgr010436 [Punica granatum]PKI48709.1 hypothetical protein CRG98_030926 [Punica granatum]
MAASSSSIAPQLVGPRASRLSAAGRAAGAPFLVRVSANGSGATACSANELGLAQGPSCIFVGPIETASKETLEALYRQARDAYYSGKPLIVDDMFDRVELKLRRYGSKSVVKYPRCSLRRQSTYADAEEDLSQAFTLASIWILFLAVGGSAFLVPILYTVGLASQDEFNSGFAYNSQALQLMAVANGFLFMAMGSLIGYPIVSASVKVLQGLWRNDLAALKGACPNCGEEVFAFVKSDQSNASPHKADCHVCESGLEFRTKAEKSVSKLGRRWVYGRIYLVSRRGRGRQQRWI